MKLTHSPSVTVKWGGAGRHVEAIFLEGPHQLIVRNQIDKAVEFIDLEAISGSKLAILCLYLRIFTARPYRIATYLIGTLIILTTVAAHILSLTICKPMSYQWNPFQPPGHCGDIILAYQMICVPNITTDVMMLILPLPAVLKLRVGTAAKVGLVITFLTGSVCVHRSP
ncbi:hypothetical protein BU23DRAFT_453532 [Bimuria novae-zelandiae CBS 107.79]|uniref:Rhodopsin domain-containing protein n=1 Tax=Bimuria novae-zelandiae CBS 107.79 TaxID=1447943 RepID=A0A6A5VID5_9PLEO|nr:hypothetical protein BU23DRAFT_453532 [Bimuria novae-zelandiae CBS 107.79]